MPFLDALSAEEHADIFGLVSKMMRCFPSQMIDDMKNDTRVQALSERYQNFCTEKSLAFATFAVWQSYIEVVDSIASICLLHQKLRPGWLSVYFNKSYPWLFAYDRMNYSRYVPIHLKEMKDLQQAHAFAHAHLENGEFTTQQQNRYSFFATASDQVIEQTLNRDCKTAGGIVGKTLCQNAETTKWITSQLKRVAKTEFCEQYAGSSPAARNKKDLDSTRAAGQEEMVQQLMTAVQIMINPFVSDYPYLVNIWSRRVASSSCEYDILNAYEIGCHACESFTASIAADPRTFHRSIKRLKLKTFSSSEKIVKQSAQETWS